MIAGAPPGMENVDWPLKVTFLIVPARTTVPPSAIPTVTAPIIRGSLFASFDNRNRNCEPPWLSGNRKRSVPWTMGDGGILSGGTPLAQIPAGPSVRC
jgi:hypothetical protein